MSKNPKATHAQLKLAYSSRSFFVPWSENLTVNLRSGSSPSTATIVPTPYVACRTRCPMSGLAVGLPGRGELLLARGRLGASYALERDGVLRRFTRRENSSSL